MNDSEKTFIIAEAGVNHNGSIEMALKLIDVAADAGADAVKFQTFKTERVMSKHAPKAEYQKQSTGIKESQFDMVKKLELDEPIHRVLMEHCLRKGIQFLSTPFDLESVTMLVETLGLPRLKIPSGEITNAPLLLRAARTGKPIILSTGMSTLGEIEEAVGVLAYGYTEKAGDTPSVGAFRAAFRSSQGQEALMLNVGLLHCTTEYPAAFSDVNLKAMATVRSAFGLPVGLSDHTPGIAVSIAAVALGAAIIEKHFTLDKKLPGPDHQASLEPSELKMLVSSIREVQQAMGSSLKGPAAGEIPNMSVARKSLIADCSIARGERFSEANLTVKRPGSGISPMHYWEWLDKTAEKDYREDDII